MTCRDFNDRLGDLFDGQPAPEERREACAHLLRCRDCSRSRRSYAAAVSLARTAYGSPVPAATPPVPEDLVERILAAARRKRSSSAAWGLVQLISGIAASQLIVFYLGH